MAWSATTTGVSAEMVCNLMIACCERRFGATKTPAPGRVAVRQRLRLHRQGDSADGRRARPTVAVHPGAFAAEQRHRGGVREDAQARLCPPRHLDRRRDRDAASAGLVRGLQHHPLALRPAHALAPRVPQPDCLNPPRCLSGQTGCTPGGSCPVRERPRGRGPNDCSEERDRASEIMPIGDRHPSPAPPGRHGT
jgi:hypothetical protein